MLAFAAVDAPVLREIAKVAFGAEKIAQRRAACGDRRRQHLLDRGDERRELRLRHVGSGLRRRDAPHVERLADIDVAKPRAESGRACCRERWWTAVLISGAA